MKIYIGADHAGFNFKNAMAAHLSNAGHEIVDVGAMEYNDGDDYPDYMTPLAERIAAEPEARGIFFAGSGQGEAMCANRIKGVRAAVFYGPMRVTETLELEGGRSEDGYDMIRLSRRHNDANVLSIGARFVTAAQADEAIRIFISTEFSRGERHIRRLSKF
jgi:ribose 5-phosphate isomerase B